MGRPELTKRYATDSAYPRAHVWAPAKLYLVSETTNVTPERVVCGYTVRVRCTEANAIGELVTDGLVVWTATEPAGHVATAMRLVCQRAEQAAKLSRPFR